MSLREWTMDTTQFANDINNLILLTKEEISFDRK